LAIDDPIADFPIVDSSFINSRSSIIDVPDIALVGI